MGFSHRRRGRLSARHVPAFVECAMIGIMLAALPADAEMSPAPRYVIAIVHAASINEHRRLIIV